jgi:NTE family protein
MSPSSKKKPFLALALSGGAARCIAHIGVLQALEDAGLEIDAVAGTSGGAMVGALYLDGEMLTDEIAALAARTGWIQLFTPSIPKKGFIDSGGIGRFMQRHLRTKNIGELSRPFAAVCTDLHTCTKVVLTSGPLAKAVQASCSLPVVFTPTVLGNRTLIDGGYVSQIPVLAAKEELGARMVVAVDVNYRSSDGPSLNSLFKIVTHLTQMVARRNAMTELPYADVIINVDIEGISLYDIKKHDELLKRGRRAAKGMVEEIKRKLEEMG